MKVIIYIRWLLEWMFTYGNLFFKATIAPSKINYWSEKYPHIRLKSALIFVWKLRKIYTYICIKKRIVMIMEQKFANHWKSTLGGLARYTLFSIRSKPIVHSKHLLKRFVFFFLCIFENFSSKKCIMTASFSCTFLFVYVLLRVANFSEHLIRIKNW